ncbi:MAG: hypothetical protein VW362_12845, partial [Candidatus Nanopelagicales bacterium]
EGGEERLPDGELVRQFVRFPKYKRKDIADALADIEAYDRKHQRVCRGANVRAAKRIEAERYGKMAGDIVPYQMQLDWQSHLVNIVPTRTASKRLDT